MKKLRPPKGDRTPYAQLWKVVDGAVADAFAMHPDYISTECPEHVVRNSIVKRVTGAVSGYAVQAARGRSLVGAKAAEKTAVVARPPQSVGCGNVPTGGPPFRAPQLFKALAWLRRSLANG